MHNTHSDAEQLLELKRVAGVCWSVRQQGPIRSLYMDAQCQSQLDLRWPDQLHYPHLQWLATQPLLHHIDRGLLVGLGGGDWLRYCTVHYPQQQWHVVESESLVLDWYQRYFALAPHHHITQADAEHFFLQHHQSYDMIFIDIYPWPQDWNALLSAALTRLTPRGYLVVNITATTEHADVKRWYSDHLCQPQYFQATGYLNTLCVGGVG